MKILFWSLVFLSAIGFIGLGFWTAMFLILY